MKKENIVIGIDKDPYDYCKADLRIITTTAGSAIEIYIGLAKVTHLENLDVS